jgi:hypothetical protein
MWRRGVGPTVGRRSEARSSLGDRIEYIEQRVDRARRSGRVISNTSPALRAAIALVCKWAIEFHDKQHFNTLTFAVIVRRLRSVHPPDGTPGNLTTSDATPCEALGEGIHLVVVAPGKSE